MDWVDPAKEVKANAEAIATGQKSIVEVCAGRGRDWREVQDQNLEAEAREAQRRADLGLPPKNAVVSLPVMEDPNEPPNPEDDTNA